MCGKSIFFDPKFVLPRTQKRRQLTAAFQQFKKLALSYFLLFKILSVSKETISESRNYGSKTLDIKVDLLI